MKRFLAFPLLFASAALLLADGGITLGQIDREGLRVTVFAAPVPIRAGPLDVTLLVQEISSNQPVTDAVVTCSLQKSGPPSPSSLRLPAWCSAIVPGARIPATLAHSRNKLLFGAYLPLTEPGRWELNIQVTRGPTSFSSTLPLDAAAPQQQLSTWWPLIALVPAAILLYVWRTTLLRARIHPAQ